jgi:hypothetical protein
VWDEFGSFEGYMSSLHSNFSHSHFNQSLATERNPRPQIKSRAVAGQDASYWLTVFGPAGTVSNVLSVDDIVLMV